MYLITYLIWLMVDRVIDHVMGHVMNHVTVIKTYNINIIFFRNGKDHYMRLVQVTPVHPSELNIQRLKYTSMYFCIPFN